MLSSALRAITFFSPKTPAKPLSVAETVRHNVRTNLRAATARKAHLESIRARVDRELEDLNYFISEIAPAVDRLNQPEITLTPNELLPVLDNKPKLTV